MTVFVQNGLARKASVAPIDSLRIGVINLMPNKQETEEQFLSIFDEFTENIAVYFYYPTTHHFKNKQAQMIKDNYLALTEQIRVDCWIVTGAPVEQMPFEKVDYWSELQQCIRRLEQQKVPVLYECWAAQAALHTLYGVDKKQRSTKLSGIYLADEIDQESVLMRGFRVSAGGLLRMPQSRQTDLVFSNYQNQEKLTVVAAAAMVGPLILEDRCGGVFITGHPEYSKETLDQEYQRDLNRGFKVNKPQNYYQTNSNKEIDYSWRNCSLQFYSNWLTQVEKRKQ
ncbi:homoserine O-acetyltransferase/O-succinyltransferase family protein [Ligilactobacillus pobuzihii]|uniref:Homoserine O-acetyltransferase n=1 Tax=Ligilactobacillus pobuzihii TaxID=449659 RepID=A0A0R2L859_9LACO|nr:homoserine O-succinyltransferase [Ligilactobacillus pobuzihii]KRK10697.1 homoserine O-succinyltransferase [Ligilactobacillus pobuzihii E100301 = KCTC 13174]KRN98041.1 homoserine O-succinyltransferase [Ligilactobacillus pobuzihii]GEN47527.1 homoserine O-succinyltransferase [Ligilactobacillus pobuzihii]